MLAGAAAKDTALVKKQRKEHSKPAAELPTNTVCTGSLFEHPDLGTSPATGIRKFYAGSINALTCCVIRNVDQSAF
ncbi:MAG: hypothetical protein ACRCUG_04060 [Yersinia sp. (in: enterobacteria)]